MGRESQERVPLRSQVERINNRLKAANLPVRVRLRGKSALTQILGDRLTNQTYLFGTFQSAGLETLNAMTVGMFPKAIEYPASLASWQQNLVTSATKTVSSLTAYYAAQPQSWARADMAGFYPFVNPVAKSNPAHSPARFSRCNRLRAVAAWSVRQQPHCGDRSCAHCPDRPGAI
jgi:hypothetical protein